MLSKEQIWSVLKQVHDPEIPVIDIVELGVLKNVDVVGEKIKVTITPTYTGCPAMRMIEDEIRNALQGYDVEILTVYAPAWSTDSMSEDTKKKLMDYGISPPEKTDDSNDLPYVTNKAAAVCPLCKSSDTVLKSFFGSTACKSLHYCNNCQQPFEHFKCI